MTNFIFLFYLALRERERETNRQTERERGWAGLVFLARRVMSADAMEWAENIVWYYSVIRVFAGRGTFEKLGVFFPDLKNHELLILCQKVQEKPQILVMRLKRYMHNCADLFTAGMCCSEGDLWDRPSELINCIPNDLRFCIFILSCYEDYGD